MTNEVKVVIGSWGSYNECKIHSNEFVNMEE